MQRLPTYQWFLKGLIRSIPGFQFRSITSPSTRPGETGEGRNDEMELAAAAPAGLFSFSPRGIGFDLTVKCL